MKKQLAIFVLASLFSVSVYADMQPSTRKECTRRCLAMDPANPQKSVHEEKLRQIREKKAVEKDSVKLEELAKAEEFEIEKHQDDLEKMCTTICKHNPEN